MTDSPRINASTPFLEGVPNSMVSREWYRLLAFMSQIIGVSQNVIALPEFEIEVETKRKPSSSATDSAALLDRLNLLEIRVGRTIAFLQNNLEQREIEVECMLLVRRPPPLNNELLTLANGNFVDGELPANVIDGANAVFTLVNIPIAGSVHLYLNGVRQRPTTDYSVSGNTITYTAGAKPKSGDNHYADYRH